MTTEMLSSYSLVAIYSAMGVYLFAFIAFTLDLAKRSAEAPASKVAVAISRVGQLVSAGQGANAGQGATVGRMSKLGGTATLERSGPPMPPTVMTATPVVPRRKSSKFERVAFALTGLGWLLHLGGTVLRGVAAHRVPWANMFEFSLTASVIIVGVFLVVQIWQDLKFLGTFITGLALIILGFGTVGFYVAVVPLPPALQSYWLIIHVFVATLGTAFYAIGAAISVSQLIQARRESGRFQTLKFLDTIPSSEKLETLAYRVIIVGFIFWTFTLMAGAIWAEHAWGRYWGWDTKEVWTFIIWTIFAGYIHARATRGWRGSRSATLAIVGFGAVMFNFTIVNLFFKGLHSYSGL